MNSDSKKIGISRLDFLKASGLMAAGFTILPGSMAWPLKGSDMTGISSYRIAIPEQANALEKEAAQQLQHYVFEMSKIMLPIAEEQEYKTDTVIYIGQTNYAKANRLDFDVLKEDGYAFKPVGSNFIIAGGSGKGVLYGVCNLLEYMGFREYTSAYTHIPKINAIGLPKKELVDVPFIKYRTTSYSDTRNPEYTNWHKLSSRDSWGLFVHTFDDLVPPTEYAKTNPEYYSLINGIREPGTQLCLSNQGLLDTLIASLRKRIAENPAAKYWSVSQNDNDQYCRCVPCTALNEKYGGVPSGSILYFVNKVAEAFPDKIISTLAYWYSRTAPKNIKGRANVNIMLCNIESRRQKPVFQTDPAFANDLKEWGKLTGNILIWDYNIQFTNLVSPFPNLHTIKPNIKFYTDNNVNSLFMQANSQVGGEMAGLRAYLICKLMWNPDADDELIINDFLNGYYGAAAPYLRRYIDCMRQSLIKSDFQLSIFGDPIDAKDTWLSFDMMNEYKQLFDRAENAVRKDTQLLDRVQVARLPIMYAEIQIGRQEIDTARSLFKHGKDGKPIVNPEMKTMVYRFVELCKKEGVTRLKERSTPPDDYLQSYKRIFTKVEEMDSAVSFNKKIIPITSPAKGSAGVQGLTDGIFGSYESWSNPDAHWVGYEGEHMEFILDLGEPIPVNSVNMDFLNAQAQPDWNLLVLPTYVSYATSLDGEKYNDDIKVINPHNPNPRENPGIDKIQMHSFHADFKNSKARYIKVHAESILHMPSWHIRTGKLAWIYCDEIVVR